MDAFEAIAQPAPLLLLEALADRGRTDGSTTTTGPTTTGPTTSTSTTTIPPLEGCPTAWQGEFYTVIPDDTWTFISRKTDTPIECLYSLNDSGPDTIIFPGQEVKVL